MLFREDNSGWVARVIDDNGSGTVINEGLELVQVDKSTILHV